MNFAFQFGFPQFILVLIAVGGLALFVYAVHSLLRGEKHYRHLTAEEKEIYLRHGHVPRRRRFRWAHGIGGILLLGLSITLLWLTFLIQAYLGLTGDLLVAQVKATNIDNSPTGLPMMSVELKQYDDKGNTAYDKTYLVLGNEWMLQGDIIKITPWMNVLGLHSGYKLTRLEGRYDDPNLEANSKHSVVELNGGDDGFFKNMHSWHGWVSPFIDAQYGNAVFLGPGATYNIYASQTGLYAKEASS